MKEKFTKRFLELEIAHNKIGIYNNGGGGRSAASGTWEGWATSAENLILAVYGIDSPHYKNYKEKYINCSGWESEILALNSIFQSAKADFEGHYVFNIDLRISGEVFGDFIALARQSLSEGYKDVAAVLACAALEDALKRFAKVNGVATDGKTMSDIVSGLKGAGLVSGAQKSLLDAMPRIRNMAMHAEWSKLTEPDVNSVLGYVEQLLLSKFSGP